jgi:hypothetical protein
MKLLSVKNVCIASLLVTGLPLIAFAQEAGSVATITGDPGSVIVMRGGESFTLSSGDAIFDGDRVVTRSGGAVELQSSDCTRALGASSSIVIGADFCETTIVSAEETILADSEIIEGGTPGAALPIVGAVLAAAGAAGAAGGGGGDSTPSSP